MTTPDQHDPDRHDSEHQHSEHQHSEHQHSEHHDSHGAHGPGRTALVTGASGYIGGQLVPRLLAGGWRVKALTRHRSSLDAREGADDGEVGEGDVSSSEAMRKALSGVDAAWYLVHSMDDRPDFQQRDRDSARTFAEAAAEAGVSRIVYLGGLHPDDEALSPHLASRVEVGRIFLE